MVFLQFSNDYLTSKLSSWPHKSQVTTTHVCPNVDMAFLLILGMLVFFVSDYYYGVPSIAAGPRKKAQITKGCKYKNVGKTHTQTLTLLTLTCKEPSYARVLICF